MKKERKDKSLNFVESNVHQKANYARGNFETWFFNFFFSLIVSDTEPDCIHYKYEPLDSLKYLSYSREWCNKIQAFQFIFGHWCNSSNHKFEIIVSYYNNNNKTVLKWPSILSTTMLLSIMKGGAKSSEPFSVNVLICCLLW